MGLDMYLRKNTYIGNEYRKEDWNSDPVVPITPEMEALNIRVERLHEITETVGQWRKANAIHGWFVDNLNDGVDNNGSMYAPEEKLQELLDICVRVLADHSLAKELLPPREGFFFGAYEYDEWYYQDLELTVEILEAALTEAKAQGEFGSLSHFMYEASW